jgi:ribosomal-protein-alanine N-acetyltransferase
MTVSGLRRLFATFPNLSTDRLELRQVQASDAPDLFAVLSDPAAMQFYDCYPYTRQEEAEAFIERWRMRFENQEGLRWAVTIKSGNKTIGTIGMGVQTEWKASLGYELGSSYWRKGLMSEALSAVIDFGFHKAELERLEAQVMPGNEASVALLLKLGFVNEGTLRSYEYFKDNQQDLMSFSLLRSEWTS